MSFSDFLGRGQRALTFQDLYAAGLDVITGRATAAGKDVTTESALTLTPVWGSIRIIHDNVSTLTLDPWIDWDGYAKPYTPRPSWMDFEVSDFGGPAVIGQGVLSMLTEGNVFYATLRDREAQVVSVTALDPYRVQEERIDGVLRHRVDGVLVPYGAVLQIPGMMLPGSTRGLSPIQYARETIGLGLAAQEFGARFFGNGAIPGALIESAGPISPVGVQQLKRAWRDVHEGAGNAHRLAVLTEGAKFSKITLAPEEAQFLQTRQFTVADVARIYGVPPHLLADASQSTSWGSGLEEQNLAFAQHALRPWVHRLEVGFTRLLRSELRPGRPYVRMDLEKITRGSFKETVETVRAAVDSGLLSLDEGRAKLGLPPLPDGKGKAHRMPLNLGEVGALPTTAKRALAEELLRQTDHAEERET